MKALVIGPVVADYDIGYNGSIARALEHFGFETKTAEFYVTTPPGLMNRLRIDAAMLIGFRKYYEEYVSGFNRHVLALYESFHPDLVFVVRGSKLRAQTLDAMSSSVKVIWLHDSAKRSDITPEQMSCYDHIYVFEAGDVAWLEETHGLKARFLPMAFDPVVYHPLENVKKDIDLFFVGKYYPERREILERLANDFPDRRLCFHGRYVRYREPATWVQYAGYKLAGKGQTFINSSLNPAEINRMYARSKICLNMHHAQSSHGCNPRVYEIMGAGAFQLVDDLPYIRETLGNVLAGYASYEQLRNQIASFLDDDGAREAAAKSARDLAMAQHTFSHRVGEVLDDCGFLAAFAGKPETRIRHIEAL